MIMNILFFIFGFISALVFAGCVIIGISIKILVSYNRKLQQEQNAIPPKKPNKVKISML